MWYKSFISGSIQIVISLLKCGKAENSFSQIMKKLDPVAHGFSNFVTPLPHFSKQNSYITPDLKHAILYFKTNYRFLICCFVLPIVFFSIFQAK